MAVTPNERTRREAELLQADGGALERLASPETPPPEERPGSTPPPVPIASVAAPPAPSPAPPAEPPKTQLQREIEEILAEGLDDLYRELSEAEQMIFKHQGEETASKIRLLLTETTVRVQEVFRLVVEWLRLLPGVSRFFIEQEAKIKTDKLIKFHH